MEKAGVFGQEKRTSHLFTKSMSHKNIGVEGFEPPAPWSQTTYSTKLSHTPITNEYNYTWRVLLCQ